MLPGIGSTISLNDVNTELAITSGTQISLNDTAVRNIAGIPTNASAISMGDLSGKSAVSIISGTPATTFSTNTTQTTINVSTLAGYSAGKSDITIKVNSGVYLYSTDTAVAALTITGATTGDIIRLVNDGYILGKGGNGGDMVGSTMYTPANAGAGGPAISLGCAVTITNNSYIAGGGGGGASAGTRNKNVNYVNTYYERWATGGGGAGGGNGGSHTVQNFYYDKNGGIGGAGGAPGLSGGTGESYVITGSYGGTFPWHLGGGGGRVVPGTGALAQQNTSQLTAVNGLGGGAGGGGAVDVYSSPAGGGGGSGGNAGGNGATKNPGGGAATCTAGGGGGWGASGGTAYRYNDGYGGGISSAGAGGAAILRNGYTVTWAASGTVYGTY